MTFIDSNTSRSDLLNAVYTEGSLLDTFISADKDPEFMSDDEIRAAILAWVEAGDECKGA